MIAETREKLECSRTNEYKTVQEQYKDCVQALESYLRQEISPDVINNAASIVLENLEKRLTQKAEDWARKYNAPLEEVDCKSAATDAIQRYSKNWRNKKQGTDNRAHRFGKSHYFKKQVN